MTRGGLLTLPAWVPGFVPEGVRPPCRDADPELFFPVGADPGIEARAVCRCCPLKTACAEWAMQTRQAYGIWGGLDPEQLEKRRRYRALQVAT